MYADIIYIYLHYSLVNHKTNKKKCYEIHCVYIAETEVLYEQHEGNNNITWLCSNTYLQISSYVFLLFLGFL